MEPLSPAPPATPSSPPAVGSKPANWNKERWRSASKQCAFCGTTFRPRHKVLANGRIQVIKEGLWLRQRYCSISCSKRQNNPMADPICRARMRATLIQAGHRPLVLGGNGRPLPAPQRALLNALGPSWSAEFIVPTKMPRGCGWPTHYKLDLADPVRRLAIEIDGHCHAGPRRRQQDRRKTAFLAQRGWCVLRISNARALWLSTTCTSADTLLTSLTGFLCTTAT
jgi:hypothetical protein